MASPSAKKKRSKKISDDDSGAFLNSQTSSSSQPQKTYVPRFLLIHAENEGESISSLSQFFVRKTIMSLTSEPKSIKDLRSGDLLILHSM